MTSRTQRDRLKLSKDVFNQKTSAIYKASLKEDQRQMLMSESAIGRMPNVCHRKASSLPRELIHVNLFTKKNHYYAELRNCKKHARAPRIYLSDPNIARGSTETVTKTTAQAVSKGQAHIVGCRYSFDFSI